MQFRNSCWTFTLLFVICIIIGKGCKNADQSEVPTLVNGELNWLNIDEMDAIEAPSKKKYLVDVYTDWCVWCKVMDQNTFTDEEVKAFLDKHFYVVKFNAEIQDPVEFGGKMYEWIPGGKNGINTLTFLLLGRRPSYPSLVFMDENKEKISVAVGYHDPEKMLEVLKDMVTAVGSKG